MPRFETGDRVRIDIPDETDPDHRFHGRHGEIVDVIDDDAGKETGELQDSQIFRIQLEDDGKVDFRVRDLRPPIEDEQE